VIGTRHRLPDLWLKRELVLALLPPGTPANRLDNGVMARCIRGLSGVPSMLNKMLAGDDPVREADDLVYWTALFEHLVMKGVGNGLDQGSLDAYIEARQGGLALRGEAVLGTFGDFALALLNLVRERADYATAGGDAYFARALERTIRACLHDVLDPVTDAHGAIGVLHGKTRDWALAPGRERIIRQPAFDELNIPQGDHVQLIIPPADEDQDVFGFELAVGEAAFRAPWTDAGSWLTPQRQARGKALFLLPEFGDDALNPRAEVPGRFWIQVVGVPVTNPNGIADVPPAVRKLIGGCPIDWPPGYAEAMASVSHIRRLSRAGKKATSLHHRTRRQIQLYNGDLTETDAFRPLAPARLYRTSYRVI
jgi:hypothetical protein